MNDIKAAPLKVDPSLLTRLFVRFYPYVSSFKKLDFFFCQHQHLLLL